MQVHGCHVSTSQTHDSFARMTPGSALSGAASSSKSPASSPAQRQSGRSTAHQHRSLTYQRLVSLLCFLLPCAAAACSLAATRLMFSVAEYSCVSVYAHVQKPVHALCCSTTVNCGCATQMLMISTYCATYSPDTLITGKGAAASMSRVSEACETQRTKQQARPAAVSRHWDGPRGIEATNYLLLCGDGDWRVPAGSDLHERQPRLRTNAAAGWRLPHPPRVQPCVGLP